MLRLINSRSQMRGLYAMALGFCLSRSPVKFVKSFATWQHLAASGGLSYRLDTLVTASMCNAQNELQFCTRQWDEEHNTQTGLFTVFTARRVCTARTMPWQDVCPSVCLSVRHTPVFCLNGYTYTQKFFTVGYIAPPFWFLQIKQGGDIPTGTP